MDPLWLSDFDVPGRLVRFDVREAQWVALDEKRLDTREVGRHPTAGRFAMLNGALYAFFSTAATNFLAIPGRIVEVTRHVTVEYGCGVDGEESWIRFLFHLHQDVTRAHELRGARVYPSRG